MDFAAALANLKRTTEQASRRRPRDDTNDRSPCRNQRPRFDNRHHRRDNDDHERNPLQRMERFGYRLLPRPYQPPETTKTVKDQPRHICLLALSIDDLPWEDIWKAWAGSCSTTIVSLVGHAKFPDRVTSAWYRRRLVIKNPVRGRGQSWADPVVHSFRPEWGSVEITRAMIELLLEGLEIGQYQPSEAKTSSGEGDEHSQKEDSNSETSSPRDELENDIRFSRRRFLVGDDDDSASLPSSVPPVDRFIFISETCLPIVSLDRCQAALFQTEQSWVNARHPQITEGTPRNAYERDQFRNIHQMIPVVHRWKADQWIVLTRSHAEAVANIDRSMRERDQLWNSFARNVNASDELYFPTALAVQGILNLEGDENIKRQAVTYTDWTQGMKNPASFAGVTELKTIRQQALQKGCLLARKFVLQREGDSSTEQVISVDEWRKTVLESEEDFPTEDGAEKPGS